MKLFLIFLLGTSLKLFAAGDHDHSNDIRDHKDAERIEVRGERIRNYLKSLKEGELAKTEVLDGEGLRRYGAQTLSEAIKQARGIDTQLLCANCGAKRISINGLRGEHSTILIDGFPLHSTISSFYGIDAVPLVGISKIEVNRGAGSSLISPESIGGSINLITIDPVKSGIKIASELGSEGSEQLSVISSHVDRNTSIQLMGFKGFSPHWDEDKNGIAESPERHNQSATIKMREDFSASTSLTLRYSESDLDIIGGNTQGYRPKNYSPSQANPEDFVGMDVRNTYTGSLDPITELIILKRREMAAALDHYLDDDSKLSVKLSSTEQTQDGLYSHAYDYNNQDQIDFASLAFQTFLGSNHLLSFGLERKTQEMNSSSQALYLDRNPPLDKDSFSFQSQSAYIMDEWQVKHDLSLSLALRIDDIAVKWLDLDQELKETVFAPRFLALWEHYGNISSRLSLGLGYRPPLTVFESQHGSSHDGFELSIDQVEKAQSGVYTFSLNFPAWFSTWSAHYTHLMNMPYAIDRISTQEPLLFVNSKENYEIWVLDWFFGGKAPLHGEWQIGFERYIYEDSYAAKLPTAAIEFRAQADYTQPSFLGSTSFQVIYVGERDLSRYGYDKHFNVYNTDISSEDFGTVSEAKSTLAPAYTQINLSHEVKLSREYKLKLRVNNLTDFTQASVDDTPATWHWHETHGHFDNFHTWGPNQGRQYFVGLEASL